jgi:transglutaminase-like putative cysteine protease
MIPLRAWIAGMMFFLSLCLGFPAGGIDHGGEWKYDLHMGSDTVGTCTITRSPVQNGILETRTLVKIAIKQAGQNIDVTLDGKTTYTWTGGLPRSYTVKITSSASPETTITAQFEDKQTIVTTDIAGKQFPTTLETKGNEFLLDNNFLVDHYAIMLASLKLAEGEKKDVRFIVPQIVSRIPKVLTTTVSNAGAETVRLGNTERKALKFLSQDNAGMKMEFWLDPEDRTLLRWKVPSQQTDLMLSTGEQTASKPLDADRLLSKSIEKLYIPSYLEMGRFQDVATLKVQIRLCAVMGEGFHKGASNQVFEGKADEKGYTTCLDGVLRTGMTIYDGKGSLPLTAKPSKNEEIFLKKTVDIPAENPEIVKVAKEAAQKATTRWEAAAASARWVHDHIRYELTGAGAIPGVGAIDAIEKRRGDCGPQSLLSISMIRSLGIPARLVGGLLYIGEKYGQHNWIEVAVRPGQWIPIDPTTGEIGRFSASHITLWKGAGGLSPDAAPMQIEVLSFARAGHDSTR